MYDELVKRLRICPDYNEGCVNCPHEHDLGCRTTTMHDAADATEELMRRCEQFQYMPPPAWIPVTERLPEKSGWYLANVFSLGVRWGEITTKDSEWIQLVFYHEGKFHKLTGSNAKVTHWMPLPTPPKEE